MKPYVPDNYVAHTARRLLLRTAVLDPRVDLARPWSWAARLGVERAQVLRWLCGAHGPTAVEIAWIEQGANVPPGTWQRYVQQEQEQARRALARLGPPCVRS